MPSSRRHAGIAGVIATAALALGAAPAGAQLPVGGVLGTVTGALEPVMTVVNPIIGTVTGVIGTVVGAVPDPTGGLVTGVTGSVGGLLTDLTSGQTGGLAATLDALLGATGAPSGAGDTLDALLTSLGLANPNSGTGSSTGSTATGTGAGTGVTNTATGVVVDAAAPTVAAIVRSHLPNMARNGKLKLQFTLSEPGVVVFDGAIRPGKALKKSKKAHASKAALIKFPAVALGFRKAGKLSVTVQLGDAARKAIAKASSIRVKLSYITADASRNSASGATKLTVKR